MAEAVNKRILTDDLVITPEQLKQIFLFGVDMTDDDGNPFPEEMFSFYIKAAQDWLQTEIGGLILCETEFHELHDYRLTDYVQYSFIKLFKYPVQDVAEVAVQFPLSVNILKFDPTWYRTESVGGQVNLFPTQGTFSSIVLSQGGSYIPLIYSGLEHVPHIMHVDYTAGFKCGKCPMDIVEIVGMKAASLVMNIAGDLIAGAGIASKSLSLDAVSQSINTTASATNTGYGARILQYEKHMKRHISRLRNHYLGLQMVVA
jgi:hypothetical protein